MYRYKETIFQFLYVEILKKQNLNVDKPKSTLMEEKKNHLKFYKFGGLRFNPVWLQIVRIIM